MGHVVTKPSEPFTVLGGALEVHQVPSAHDNLIWVAVCTATREAAAVDGPGIKEVRAWAEGRDVRLKTILNTHTHHDHIGINMVLEREGVLGDWRVVGARQTAADIPGLTEPVGPGDTVRIGEVEGQVLLTEGHIDGHLSYVFGDALFCGDTLFAGGCGYLFDGPPETMHRSLMRLAALPGSTRVCCAHEYTQDNLRFAWSVEPDNEALAERIRRVWAVRAEGGCAVPSTVEEERATNPFLRPGSPAIQAAVAAAFPDRDLSTPAAVFAAVRALKDTKRYRENPESALPLE